ncbi:MAG: amidase [Gammaproteobacteria bacterium]|nr:amidase [Gammaproteobacteria bacterium]
MTEFAFESAASLARRLRAKEISSVELLSYYFDRVDKFNGPLNAIIWEIRDEAMEDAKRADAAIAAGEISGPLHGVPMTIKESYDVKGTPSTWGAPYLKDNIASQDALSVQRLRAAGAVIFGKTNVPLMLSDFQSYNEIYGTTNNPYDVTRIPGGSSGGSAATLAAGMTGIESGSDIGGSIRNPAHFCGVFGHKPTWNMLPPRGHATPGILSPSDLSVIGPLGRGAEDVEIATRVMAGPNEIESRGLKLELPEFEKQASDLKVAVWRDDEMAPVDNSVSARVDAVAEVLQSEGAQLDYDARPDFTSQHTHFTYQSLLSATMACRVPEEQYQRNLEAANGLDPNDESLDAVVRRSQVARFREWIGNNEKRTHIRWAWHNFFEEYDIVLMPIMARSAFPHDHRAFGERTITVNGEQQAYFLQVFWAGLPTNAYLPSTIVPTGLDDEGLPIGVQVVGPEYGDLTTLGVARLLEKQGFTFTPPAGY